MKILIENSINSMLINLFNFKPNHRSITAHRLFLKSQSFEPIQFSFLFIMFVIIPSKHSSSFIIIRLKIHEENIKHVLLSLSYKLITFLSSSIIWELKSKLKSQQKKSKSIFQFWFSQFESKLVEVMCLLWEIKVDLKFVSLKSNVNLDLSIEYICSSKVEEMVWG